MPKTKNTPKVMHAHLASFCCKSSLVYHHSTLFTIRWKFRQHPCHVYFDVQGNKSKPTLAFLKSSTMMYNSKCNFWLELYILFYQKSTLRHLHQVIFKRNGTQLNKNSYTKKTTLQ